MAVHPIKRALISVSDKRGIRELATELQSLGVTILATGGTAKLLKDRGIRVTDVSEYTGFPEILDGRVKTLHPKIFAGILVRRCDAKGLKNLDFLGIAAIDLVIVNLYPFSEQPGIEMIDIGGPSLLRAAAKNYEWVSAVCDPQDYPHLIEQLKTEGGTTLSTRKKWAAKAFERTFHYDRLIMEWIRNGEGGKELLDLHYEKVRDLRYGENPHQKAWFFRNPENFDVNVTNAKVLQGKPMSFNNILDADAAIELVKEFPNQPTVVFIKHANPCGVASADTIEKAFQLAYEVDPLSAFGSIVAMNQPCTKKICERILQQKIFIELLCAPSFSKDALAILSKRQKLRVLELGPVEGLDIGRRDLRKVAGGILMQEADTKILTEKDLKIVSREKPTKGQIRDMLFASKIVKHVRSNAIVFAKNEVVTGIGAGQMSRVDAVHLARYKGKHRCKGSVMASDAFFPFPDAVTEAAKAGIAAIIQPGGSIRDQEIIETVDAYKMAMAFSGVRMFKH